MSGGLVGGGKGLLRLGVVVLSRGEGLVGWWVAGVESGDGSVVVVDEVDFFVEVGLED